MKDRIESDGLIFPASGLSMNLPPSVAYEPLGARFENCSQM